MVMAISEFEIFKVEKVAKEFCSKRNVNFPPDQLYIDYRLEDQVLYLFEVRPRWDEPNIKAETMVAKLWYIKKDKLWKLYWQRQNMKWHLYEGGINKNLEPLLVQVNEDNYGCFWG
ncbi:MAG TPA: DUF3024 domain-containing protein [Methylococcaceae bacterium]|nr:DUF3024 domain-containing protein [Methylococcaceae bacterium]HIA45803.1 DUF3024 domain-containing protein [Methylococcaceae bacterium]HIN69374.1 DUF3024 domain-containing protein [Methylococcales bacterium]